MQMIEGTESDSRSLADLRGLPSLFPPPAESRKFLRLDRTTKEVSDISVITTSEDMGGMPRPMPLRPDLREAAQQEAFGTSRRKSPLPVYAPASLPRFTRAASSLTGTSRTTLFGTFAGVERTGEQAPSTLVHQAAAESNFEREFDRWLKEEQARPM